MRKGSSLPLSLLVVALLLPRTAAADPISIAFEATVTYVHGDMQSIFGAPVSAGDVLGGSLVFDPSGAMDGNPDPLFAFYRVSGLLSLGNEAGVEGPLSSIQVTDDRWGVGYPTDSLAAVASDVPLSGFSGAQMIALFFGDPGNQTGDPLPGTAAAFIAAYNLPGSFEFTANQNGVEPPWDDTTHRLFARIRLLPPATAPVPEPGTLMLLAGGVAALGRAASRRRLEHRV